MSRVIAVAAEKGGVLKSTAAVLLADAAARAGHFTQLVQAGLGQGSAIRYWEDWHAYCSEPGARMRKPKFSNSVSEESLIAKEIKALAHDVVVVDVGGGAGTERWAVRLEAAKAADLVVMPVKRQYEDIYEAEPALAKLKKAGTPVAVLLTLGAEKHDDFARERLTPLCDQMLTTTFPTRQGWADRYGLAPNTDMCAAADALAAEVGIN